LRIKLGGGGGVVVVVKSTVAMRNINLRRSQQKEEDWLEPDLNPLNPELIYEEVSKRRKIGLNQTLTL